MCIGVFLGNAEDLANCLTRNPSTPIKFAFASAPLPPPPLKVMVGADK